MIATGRFATTQWSLVLAAGSAGGDEALARLCALYWYPVFVFIRRQGYATDDAHDLTQSFFTRLIEKQDLGAADPDRGRFRSFLLTSCQHFLANQRDREQALKRGGGQRLLSIDVALAEERYQVALSHAETPERLYERQWSLALLSAVLDDVRASYAAAGKERIFDRLRGFLTADDDAGTHAGAARELGTTPGAIKVAVHRLRERYRDALLSRVADTVASPQDVSDEIRHLIDRL